MTNAQLRVTIREGNGGGSAVSDDLIEKIARAIFNASLIEVGRTVFWNADDSPHQWPGTEIKDMSRNLARAALSAIEKSGTHVVVPKEPTDEMFANASDSPGSRMACQHVWADMLSARPPLPETEGKG